MSVWKLSIKPDAETDFDPFALCRNKSLVGVGWSYIFDGRKISNKSESYQALRAQEGGTIPKPIERLLDEVKAGDFVWLHQSGGYYLCEITDNATVLGPQIDENYRQYDLGHARRALWVEVPELLVPGRVQRSTIVRRMIQKMDCSGRQEKYFGYLHSKISKNPRWFPAIEDKEIAKSLSSLSSQDLRDVLSPDDYEDIVAAYLQAKGWTLVKSTYFRTKPEFEFLVVRPGPLYAHVQVKSGDVPLAPADYIKWVNDNECVFLFSTHPTPYPGPPVKGVNCLEETEVIGWVAENTWALSLGIKVQLQLMWQE